MTWEDLPFSRASCVRVCVCECALQRITNRQRARQLLLDTLNALQLLVQHLFACKLQTQCACTAARDVCGN
jgi:hypothetical protein